MAAQTGSKSLVIGLDFGTTYSGAAWALVNDQRLEVLSTWPGGVTRTSVKVPTVMAYSNDRFLWGYQALASLREPIRGMKLLLDDNQSYRYNPSIKAKKILGSLGKSPVDVAADYLEKLISQVQQILDRRFGPAMKDMHKEFILTVPAVWSDKAKDATLKVAIKAGIPENQLCLLSEPEAAALYTLRMIQPNSIKKGDTFMVCDAGGGTVDLISYRINHLSPLSLEEVVEGTGGLCGSMILDENFERFLEKLLGFSTFETLPTRSKDGALRYWQETIKPHFLGVDSDDEYDDIGWELPLPGSSDMPLIGLEGGFLQLSKTQVQGIFDPVVQDVLSLIQAQVRKIKVSGLSIQAILLVGGFGGCEYLYRRICKANPRLLVMQPPDAWQAIVCGAVYRGLEGNQVKSRLTRGHYGVEVSSPWNRCVHTESEKIWDPCEEKWIIYKVMNWFLSKGSSVSKNNPVRKPFYRTIFCDDKESLKFKTALFFSDSKIAPTR